MTAVPKMIACRALWFLMSAVRGDRYAGPLALGIFPVMYTSERRVPMEWKLLQKN